MSSLDSMKEMRRDFGWRMDNIEAELRRAVSDMADDAAHIKEMLKGGFGINGFDHTRGSRGAGLDALIAKRKQLAEVIHALDYHIKADEAEEASS